MGESKKLMHSKQKSYRYICSNTQRMYTLGKKTQQQKLWSNKRTWRWLVQIKILTLLEFRWLQTLTCKQQPAWAATACVLGCPRKKWAFPIFDFFEGESDFEYFLESRKKNPFWKIGLRIEGYLCSRHLQAELTRICHEHTKSSIRKPIFQKGFSSWDSKKFSKSLFPLKQSKIGKSHFFSGTP